MTGTELLVAMVVCLVVGIILSELGQAVARRATPGNTRDYGHKTDTFTESTEL